MKEKIRIGIVEDEVIIAQNLFELLNDLDYDAIEPANNFEEGLELIKNKALDLIILDIRLDKGQDGIELGKFINENHQFPIIYLTANADKETMQIAKNTNPAAYLIKPFSKKDLIAAIEIVKFKENSMQTKRADQNIVQLKNGNEFHSIYADEILFVESNHIFVKVYTNSTSYLHRSSLKQFLQDLNNSKFIQTHRSYIVNITLAQEVNQSFIKTGKYVIPVSESFKMAVRNFRERMN